jgi:hypothetical protein
MSTRTCHSTDGPCGRPSAQILMRPGTEEKWTWTYEDTGATFSCGALATKTFDLAIRVDLVVLQDGHLDLLALVFDFLGGLNEQAISVRERGETC